MSNQPIHILNHLGVITSFSIAKKVTDRDIKRFIDKHKRSGKKTTRQITHLLNKKILEEIQDALYKNLIPGLLSSQDIANEDGMNENIVENMPEINRLIIVISNKLIDKNYDKMALCYLINSLVNILKLTETDFEAFGNIIDPTDDDEGFREEGEEGGEPSF